MNRRITIGTAMLALPWAPLAIRGPAKAEGAIEGRFVIEANSKRIIDGLQIDGRVDKNAPRVLYWETDRPYESIVDVGPGAEVVIRNCEFRHYSKSVANNFAIYVREGATLTLENVQITSTSGSGIGVEGGSLFISSSTVSNCKTHGILITASLDGSVPGSATIGKECMIVKNGGVGILALEDASVKLSKSAVVGGNKGGDRLEKGYNAAIELF